MFIQLQKSLIDSIRQFTNLEKQQQPTDDTIAMIIGLSIAIVILFAFFIYLAYFLPWWTCYNCFFSKVVTCSNSCLDCILCYYVCPCMDRTAYGYQLEQNQKNSKVFVQDMLTTPDGCIIHLSDIRTVKQPHRSGSSMQPANSKSSSSKFSRTTSDDDLDSHVI